MSKYVIGMLKLSEGEKVLSSEMGVAIRTTKKERGDADSWTYMPINVVETDEDLTRITQAMIAAKEVR